MKIQWNAEPRQVILPTFPNLSPIFLNLSQLPSAFQNLFKLTFLKFPRKSGRDCRNRSSQNPGIAKKRGGLNTAKIFWWICRSISKTSGPQSDHSTQIVIIYFPPKSEHLSPKMDHTCNWRIFAQNHSHFESL